MQAIRKGASAKMLKMLAATLMEQLFRTVDKGSTPLYRVVGLEEDHYTIL